MTKKTKNELVASCQELYRKVAALRQGMQTKQAELFAAQQELSAAEDQLRDANAELASAEE